MTTKREKRKQKELEREKRTERILNKISYETYSKPINMLSPRQIDMVLNKMLYNSDKKGRNPRQVK